MTASFGEAFRLTLITDNPLLAAVADQAGVDRIGLDFERLRKAQRQAGHDTRLSEHRWDDAVAIGAALRRASLFARLNPINPDTASEVETALRHRIQVLMLPFFSTAGEVETFVRLVGGRAQVVILVETSAAVVRIRDVLSVPGIDEVMFGLNDLHLQLGVSNHFEVLASPLLDGLAAEVRRAGLRLSVGGVARVDDLALPVPPDLVYAQFPRLGATGAWLSRSFLRGAPPLSEFADAITALRRRLTAWSVASPQSLERARADLVRHARPALTRS